MRKSRLGQTRNPTRHNPQNQDPCVAPRCPAERRDDFATAGTVVAFPASYSGDGNTTSVSKSVLNATVFYRQLITVRQNRKCGILLSRVICKSLPGVCLSREQFKKYRARNSLCVIVIRLSLVFFIYTASYFNKNVYGRRMHLLNVARWSENCRRGRGEAPRESAVSSLACQISAFQAPPGAKHDHGISPFLSMGRPHYVEKARLMPGGNSFGWRARMKWPISHLRSSGYSGHRS